MGWTPTIKENARIYYSGILTNPDNFHSEILSKVIHQPKVPELNPTYYDIPGLKSSEWYLEHGYNSTIKADNMKLYGHNINVGQKDSTGQYTSAYTNAIIVSQGDININGWVSMTGVLFAPNGKVTFNGASFEGLVIAKDGFYVTSGGSYVTFKPISTFIKDEKEFPLQ